MPPTPRRDNSFTGLDKLIHGVVLRFPTASQHGIWRPETGRATGSTYPFVWRDVCLLSPVDQPLWQIWLNITWIAFVARRAAVGIGLHWNHLGGPLRFAYGAVLGVCALAAVAVWLPARWVVTGLVAVAAAFTVTTFIEISPGSATLPVSWGVVQWLIGVAAGAILVRLAWRADDAPHSHPH